MKVIEGTNRNIVLLGNYAIKFPNINSLRCFLLGLLANSDEVRFTKQLASTRKINPVLFRLPFGLCNVYQKAEPIGHDVFWSFKYDEWIKIQVRQQIPVEHKYSSFGIVKGEIVAVDYHEYS